MTNCRQFRPREGTEPPSFFMVAEGHLVFANGYAAARGINELPRSIAHIELRWGDPCWWIDSLQRLRCWRRHTTRCKLIRPAIE
jgi:hypothetical protein